MTDSYFYGDASIFYVKEEHWANCQPFGFDVGGSLGKLTYKCKDDKWCKENGLCVIHAQCFDPKNVGKVIEWLKAQCDTSDFTEDVVCTGLGSDRNSQNIIQTMRVKGLQIVHEATCQVNAFMYLKSVFPLKEFVQPLNQVTEEKTLKAYSQFYTGDMPNHYCGSSKWLDGQVEFPCLVMMTGSAFGFLIIQSDGSAECVNISWCGGRCFFGLARALCGVQSFEELECLTEKGDASCVDECIHDLTPDDTDAKYDNFGFDLPNVPVFRFGKAARKETDTASLKKEDLAAALLKVWTNNVILECEAIARAEGCTSVYFQGGFVSSPVVHKQLTEHITTQNMFRQNMRGKEPMKYFFLKHGGFYGAFGALMSSAFKSEGWKKTITWKPH